MRIILNCYLGVSMMTAEPLSYRRRALYVSLPSDCRLYSADSVLSAVAWLKNTLDEYCQSQLEGREICDKDIELFNDLIDEAFKDVLGDEK